jgi:hypothetical protein
MQQMNMKTSLSVIFILMLQLQYPVNIVTCVIDEGQKDEGQIWVPSAWYNKLL